MKTFILLFLAFAVPEPADLLMNIEPFEKWINVANVDLPFETYHPQGIVKIGDYGLAKFISCSRRSGQTESVGTVHYMAPEIANGRYGIFEILKHIAPGILCDLIVPIATANGRRPLLRSTRPTGRIGPKASVCGPRRAISSIGIQPSK